MDAAEERQGRGWNKDLKVEESGDVGEVGAEVADGVVVMLDGTIPLIDLREQVASLELRQLLVVPEDWHVRQRGRQDVVVRFEEAAAGMKV